MECAGLPLDLRCSSGNVSRPRPVQQVHNYSSSAKLFFILQKNVCTRVFWNNIPLPLELMSQCTDQAGCGEYFKFQSCEIPCEPTVSVAEVRFIRKFHLQIYRILHFSSAFQRDEGQLGSWTDIYQCIASNEEAGCGLGTKPQVNCYQRHGGSTVGPPCVHRGSTVGPPLVHRGSTVGPPCTAFPTFHRSGRS